LNKYELETFELIFQLVDHNEIQQNEVIGLYSVGLSSIYRHAKHEFHRIWLRLVNPNTDNKNNPSALTGYLKVSCFIVGPNESPPNHRDDDDDEDFGNIEEKEQD
jgi:hypothetical protein